MRCEQCSVNDATKELRIEPKENPSLGKSMLVCEDCVPGLQHRYGARSDRQVSVADIGKHPKWKSAWSGMTGNA